jgi:O-antigen ligase
MQKTEVKKIIGYILIGVFLILFSYYTVSLYVDYPQYLLYILCFSLSSILFVVSIFNLEISFVIFIFLMTIVEPLRWMIPFKDFHFHFFLFLGFFLGGLINIIRRKKSLLDLNLRIYSPAVIFIILSFISLVFTLLRLKFIPFIASGISDFNVNILVVGNLQAIKYAVNRFLIYLSGFLLFFIVSRLKIDKKSVKSFFYFLSASFLITFFFGWYQILIDPHFSNFGNYALKYQFNSTFIDPNSYGMYLCVLIPAFIGFGYYLYNRKKILGFYSFILSPLAVVMLFYTGARAEFIGLAIIMIFYFFYFGMILMRRIFRRFNMRKLLLNLISCFIIIAILSSALFGLVFFIKNMDINENYPGIFTRLKANINSFEENDFETIMNRRQRNWNQAVNMFIDYPISGVGISQYFVQLPNYNVRVYGNAISNQLEDPLNLYLQILSEMGIIPLLIILWFFVEVIIFSIIFYRKIESKGFRFLFLNLLLSFVVLLVVSIFDSFVNNYSPLFIFFALIGILVNFSINYKKKDYEPIYLNEK